MHFLQYSENWRGGGLSEANTATGKMESIIVLVPKGRYHALHRIHSKNARFSEHRPFKTEHDSLIVSGGFGSKRVFMRLQTAVRM